MSNSTNDTDSKNAGGQGEAISQVVPPLFSVERTAGDLIIVIELADGTYLASHARSVGDNIVTHFNSWDREGKMHPPTTRPLAAYRTFYGPWRVLDSRVSALLPKVDDRFEENNS